MPQLHAFFGASCENDCQNSFCEPREQSPLGKRVVSATTCRLERGLVMLARWVMTAAASKRGGADALLSECMQVSPFVFSSA